METEKKSRAKEFIRKFHDSRPKDFFKKLDDKDKGSGLIMFMLADSTGDVLAGDISKTLGMSTPQVATALNSLEKKGFVARCAARSDKRKTVVRLTDAGVAEIERVQVMTEQTVEYLMGAVGERDMNEFLRIVYRIKDALERKEKCANNE